MFRLQSVAGWALAVLVCAGASARAIELYGIEGPHTLGEGYFLGVIGGEVRWAKSGGGREDWEFVRTDQGILIRRLESSAGKDGPRYLSYDPEGKDLRVFLSVKPGPGSYWSAGKNTVDGQLPFLYSIRAREGKVAGWFLDVGDKAEQGKDFDGAPFTARKVVLTARPRTIPRFDLVEIAP